MRRYLRDDIENAVKDRALKIDGLLSARAINLGLLDEIDMVGPYGAGHPQPVFVLPDLRLQYAKALRGGHIRCSFSDTAGQRIDGICFRAEDNGLEEILMSRQDQPLHVAVRVVRNSWQGRERADVHIVDLAYA